jgi:hypothetical protein
LINDPVKVTYVNGDLLMEAHPPIDGEGQSIAPNLDLLAKQLDRALGSSVAAIHWDFAREALAKADGMPAVVGVEADPDTAPARGIQRPAAAAAPVAAAAAGAGH